MGGMFLSLAGLHWLILLSNSRTSRGFELSVIAPFVDNTVVVANSKYWFTTSFLLGGKCRKAEQGVCGR